jgi:hypothetical protein
LKREGGGEVTGMGDAIDDQTITEVKDGAPAIDPCTAAADAFGGVDA